jgi:hypothetical protein
MTTSYIVKKCNSVTFVQDVSLVDIPKSNVLSIMRTPIPKVKNYTIKELPILPEATIIVELGYKTIIHENVLRDDYTEDHTIRIDSDLKELEFQECMSIFRNLCADYTYLNEKQMSPKFIDFLSTIYLQVKNSKLKQVILDILSAHNIPTTSLKQQNPLEYDDVEVPAIINCDAFSDIEIIVNDNTEGFSSGMYKSSQEDLKKASVGKSAYLDAFTKGLFTVVRGRKTANIENPTLKQNNTVINLLAANGVICTPETSEVLSLDLLMDKLSKMKTFDIIFIHPSLEQKSISFDSPTEFTKPEYKMNGGEIIAIAYRYMLIHFFGMHSIIDDSLLEYQYLF